MSDEIKNEIATEQNETVQNTDETLEKEGILPIRKRRKRKRKAKSQKATHSRTKEKAHDKSAYHHG